MLDIGAQKEWFNMKNTHTIQSDLAAAMRFYVKSKPKPQKSENVTTTILEAKTGKKKTQNTLSHDFCYMASFTQDSGGCTSQTSHRLYLESPVVLLYAVMGDVVSYTYLVHVSRFYACSCLMFPSRTQ